MSVRRLVEAFNNEAGSAATCTQAYLDVVGGSNQVITLKVVINGAQHTLQTPIHRMDDDGYEEVRKLAREIAANAPTTDWVEQPADAPAPQGAMGGEVPGAAVAPAAQVTGQAVQADPLPAPVEAVPAPPPVAAMPPVPPGSSGALTIPEPSPPAPLATTPGAEGRSGRKAPTADQLPNPFFD